MFSSLKLTKLGFLLLITYLLEKVSVINYSPGGVDINHEDGVGDGIVVMTVQRGNRRKGAHRPEKLWESCFYKKNNRKNLVKVSKSQLIKVRRHILTSAAGFMERLQGFHGHPEASYWLYTYVCRCIFFFLGEKFHFQIW